MNRGLVLLILAAIIMIGGAGAVQAAVIGGIEFSTDSDDARMLGVSSGYYIDLKGSPARTRLGFQAGMLRYRDTPGRESFRFLELDYRSEPMDGARVSLEVRGLDGRNWSPFLWNLTATYSGLERWYFELFGGRDLVDTVESIRLKYLIDSLGLSADYSLTETLTLVGALFSQSISDGNRRLGRIARVVYTPRTLEWMNFQVKARILDSDLVGTGYFSPERLSEYFLLAGFSKPFSDENWIVRGQAGPGVQRVEGHDGSEDTKSAFMAEIKLKGWFTRQFGLDSRLGYTSARETGSGDHYQYGEVHFTYAW